MTIKKACSRQIALAVGAMFIVLPSCTSAETINLNGHQFSLTDGYSIELACAAGLVQRPIVADFDEEGRLYVAESSGTNVDVNTQLEERPHWITRLEDTNGDGTFDRRTTFADKMMFPKEPCGTAGRCTLGLRPAFGN